MNVFKSNPNNFLKSVDLRNPRGFFIGMGYLFSKLTIAFGFMFVLLQEPVGVACCLILGSVSLIIVLLIGFYLELKRPNSPDGSGGNSSNIIGLIENSEYKLLKKVFEELGNENIKRTKDEFYYIWTSKHEFEKEPLLQRIAYYLLVEHFSFLNKFISQFLLKKQFSLVAFDSIEVKHLYGKFMILNVYRGSITLENNDSKEHLKEKDRTETKTLHYEKHHFLDSDNINSVKIKGSMQDFSVICSPVINLSTRPVGEPGAFNVGLRYWRLTQIQGGLSCGYTGYEAKQSGKVTQDVTGLCASDYPLAITDLNGCTKLFARQTLSDSDFNGLTKEIFIEEFSSN